MDHGATWRRRLRLTDSAGAVLDGLKVKVNRVIQLPNHLFEHLETGRCTVFHAGVLGQESDASFAPFPRLAGARGALVRRDEENETHDRQEQRIRRVP